MLIYSISNIPSKLAAGESFLSLKFCMFYGLLLLLLVIYAILWQQMLKRFSLTIAYACKATTIIWSMLIGFFIFKEGITFANIIGAIIVMVGIVIMIKGEQTNE